MTSTATVHESDEIHTLADVVAILKRVEKALDRSPLEYFSIEQATTITGLSDDHIRRAILGGTLPASNVGTPDRPYYRISRENLKDWMEQRKAGAFPPPARKKVRRDPKPLPVSPHFPRSSARTCLAA